MKNILRLLCIKKKVVTYLISLSLSQGNIQILCFLTACPVQVGEMRDQGRKEGAGKRQRL